MTNATGIRYGGLRLIPPSGSRPYWRVKGTLPDGRLVDTSGGKSQAEAEKRAFEAATNIDVKPKADVRRNSNTRYAAVLAEFVKPENHERWGSNGGNRHADDIKSTLWNHVLPVLGKRTCGSLQPSDFRGILQTMRSEGYSPSTIKNVGGAMRATVTFMHNERYLDQTYDPMRGVSYRARAITGGSWVAYKDRPTIAHKDALAEGMRIFGGHRWWVATQIAALAGPRWGELLYLTPRHFDLARCEILIERQWNQQSRRHPDGVTGSGGPGGHFVAALPKNGSERMITYPAWLNPYLESLIDQVGAEGEERLITSGRIRNPMGLMFCTPEGTIPWRSSWNRNVITLAREYAQWPAVQAEAVRKINGKNVKRMTTDYRWTWHSLRHLFCSLAISNDEYGYGLDPVDAATLAGHSLEVFLQKYVQAPPDFTEHTARQMAKVPAPRGKSHVRSVAS